MRVGDTSALSARQRFGFALVHALAWLQAWVYRWIIRDRVWRSADGRCTPVKRMSDRHLANTLAMLRRRDPRSEWAEVMRAELARRGKTPPLVIRADEGREWLR